MIFFGDFNIYVVVFLRDTDAKQLAYIFRSGGKKLL